AVDEPGARRRVGQRADDDELTGVGDHNTLGAGLIVCRAHEHRLAFVDPDDPGQGVGLAGDVADDLHPGADHHPAPAQLAGAHRGHGGVGLDETGVAAPVDGHDEALDRVGVLGTAARTRARGRTRAYPHIVLVVLAWPPQSSPPVPVTIADHSPGNSGRVFAVHATSVSTTPGRVRPSTASARAIR